MLAEERQRVILRVLEEKRAATVAVLCQETGASEATIRRDLNELNRQGKLNKVHGGAVLPVSEFESQEPDVLTKSTLYTEQKDRIARYAAAQVNDQDFVFIDAGTTTLRMAEYLEGSKATFVTTGIECARRLVEKGLLVYVAEGNLCDKRRGLRPAAGGKGPARLCAGRPAEAAHRSRSGRRCAGNDGELQFYQGIYRNQWDFTRSWIHNAGHRGGIHQVTGNRPLLCQLCAGRFQ